MEQWTTELVKRRKRHLGLGLRPNRPDNLQIRCRADGVFQQRRLSDPGSAEEHEGPAVSCPQILEEPGAGG